MTLSKTLESISKHFQISKETLYQSFLHDNYFRVFVKSAINSNVNSESLCKKISEKHYLFMTDFYRNQKN